MEMKTKLEVKEPKPRCKLVGTDGNAFAIMGRIHAALRDAGHGSEYINSVMAEMRSGDYDHLLAVACEVCEVE